MIMKPIYMTEQDRHRLQDLIEVGRAKPNGHANYIDDLEREVSRSCVVDGKSVPGDVVRFDCQRRRVHTWMSALRAVMPRTLHLNN